MSNRKPPGSINKIREFELEKITLSDEFDILQIVGEGWFGKILLVEHRATDTEMVLKALPKPYVSLRDFYREFHYGLHLGVHKNIVTTYDVAFETAGFYVFTQEYALLGDLTSNVSDSGIGELHSKKVAKQIASALDYMHSKDIVHRDVKLDNVLIYKSDFSRVKLCDFGESYKTGTIVERRNEWLPYSPPEVLQIKPEGTYPALPSHDVWQFAIVIFVCLTGCLPWQKAASDDPRYTRYLAWQGVNMMIPLRRTPKLFKLLSGKGSRMFRKFLEPRPERRPKNLSELSRFLDDRWLAKGAEKDMAEYEPDELCPSMYSFHSSPEEKNRVLWSLAEHGIETTVDRKAKKNRIKDWIESSVIFEDDEEEDSGSASASPSSSISREPVPGHISSVRATSTKETQTVVAGKINTTIKDASNKHFDPRTGVIQQGPSEMGGTMRYRNESLNSIATTIETTISPGSERNSNSLNSSLITLGSRNNLIMSEGQPYNSDMNLVLDNIMDDDDIISRNDDLIIGQPMVNHIIKKNARHKIIPVSNQNSDNNNINISNNNNNLYNNIQNTTLMLKNNLQTFSNTNLTEIKNNNDTINTINTINTVNITTNNNQINNNRKIFKPIQRTKSDSIKKVMLPTTNNLLLNDNFNFYASTSSINIINNNINNSSISSNNNNSNSNSNININGNTARIGLLSAFQSIAPISVPEANNQIIRKSQFQIEQDQQQQQQPKQSIFSTTANKMTITNSKNIIDNQQYKRIGSPVFNNRKTSTTIMLQNEQNGKKRTELSRSHGNLLLDSFNFNKKNINGGKFMLSLPKQNDESIQTTTTITMKDTPYDRFKK